MFLQLFQFICSNLFDDILNAIVIQDTYTYTYVFCDFSFIIKLKEKSYFKKLEIALEIVDRVLSTIF